MLTFRQYLLQEALSPTDADARQDLLDRLAKLGFDNLKKDDGKSKTITILTTQNRREVYDQLETGLSELNARYDDTKSSSSSLGFLEVGKFKVVVKPEHKQGSSSAGKDNEELFLAKIVEVSSEENPITVIFVDKHGGYREIKDVIGAKDMSQKVKGTTDIIKSDVDVITKHGKVPVSIKKVNAEFWANSSSALSKEGADLLEKALRSGLVKLEPIDAKSFKLAPELAIPANKHEIKMAVFGDDIEKHNGLIAIRTFASKDFEWDDEFQTLTIQLDKMIERVSQVEKEGAYLLYRYQSGRTDMRSINNDLTNNQPLYGIRFQVCTQKRIHKSTLVLDRNTL